MREIEGHDCEIRAEIVRVRGSTKRQLGFVAALTSAQNFCGDRDLRETIIVLEEVERGEKKHGGRDRSRHALMRVHFSWTCSFLLKSFITRVCCSTHFNECCFSFIRF